jgi:hypothetical protein
MKVLLLLVLALGLQLSFPIQSAGTKTLQENDALKQKAIGLEVSLVPDKRTYKPGDRIKLEVKLINSNGVKDIFVYGTLQFGVRASLMLFRRDAKGKEVPTRFIDSGWELPTGPNDTGAFVKLLPFHFLGTTYRSSIYMLHMERPGRYSMWVEYQSPISAADVQLKPFFGTENGPIKSNVVSIQVVR